MKWCSEGKLNDFSGDWRTWSRLSRHQTPRGGEGSGEISASTPSVTAEQQGGMAARPALDLGAPKKKDAKGQVQLRGDVGEQLPALPPACHGAGVSHFASLRISGGSWSSAAPADGNCCPSGNYHRASVATEADNKAPSPAR